MDCVENYAPQLLVVHPYFGMELNDKEVSALEKIRKSNCKVVLDLTQCVFSTKRYPFISFVVGSYRKWFPIPDGAFLECNQDVKAPLSPDDEYSLFTESLTAAMYLRGLYFKNKEQLTKRISIRLSKYADNIAENNIVPHKMSQIAYKLLRKQDFAFNQERRISNYGYLFHNINDGDDVRKVCKDLGDVSTAPLYFPIYANKRESLQRKLAQEAVYAPIVWPVEDSRVLINSEVEYIYKHLLAIPCDQRYDENDLQRAVNIIND